jgi:hypothetical protein
VPDRQAAADADSAKALEQVVRFVVDEFPGERKQQRGGFGGFDLLFGWGVSWEALVDLYCETQRRRQKPIVCATFWCDYAVVQELAPLGQGFHHAFGTVFEKAGGPVDVALQVPAEFFRFDGAQRRGEGVWVAFDIASAIRRVVNELGGGGGAALAFGFLDGGLG